MVFLIAALAAAAMPPADKMGFTHGSDIIERCTDPSPQAGSFCFGFIAAVYESMHAYETWLNIREVCVPEDVTLADMRDTVVARITASPNDRLGQGASVVVAALKAKWPCAAPPPAPVVTPTPTPAPKPQSAPPHRKLR